MAPGFDQAAGWGMVSFAGFVFTYYSIWVIILPFVEPDQPVHKFFLPRIYAIAGPLIAGVIALVLIGMLVIAGVFALVLIGAFVLHVTASSKKGKAKTS